MLLYWDHGLLNALLPGMTSCGAKRDFDLHCKMRPNDMCATR
jgi:hypothetical protein